MYKQEQEEKKEKETRNKEMNSSYNSTVYESEDDLLQYIPLFTSVMMLAVDLKRYQKQSQPKPQTTIKREPET